MHYKDYYINYYYFRITLPDGKEVPAESLKTKPIDIALGISKGTVAFKKKILY